jgi:hypothetical protein
VLRNARRTHNHYILFICVSKILSNWYLAIKLDIRVSVQGTTRDLCKNLFFYNSQTMTVRFNLVIRLASFIDEINYIKKRDTLTCLGCLATVHFNIPSPTL